MVGSGLILVCAHGDAGRLMDGKSREFQDLALQFNVRSTDTVHGRVQKGRRKDDMYYKDRLDIVGNLALWGWR